MVYRTTNAKAPPMEMSMRLSGTGHASFATSDGTITYTNSNHSFTGTMTMKIGGTERSIPFDRAIGDSMAGPIRGSQRCRCSDAELALEAPATGVPIVWVR